MTGASEDWLHHNRFRHQWNSHFSNRQAETVYRRENKAFCFTTGAYELVNDSIQFTRLGRTQPTTTAQIIGTFLQRADAGPYHHQTVELQKFCEGVNLRVLTSSQEDLSQSWRATALIDDRNEEGIRCNQGGTCRISLGALNPRQLFQQLRRPRYKDPTDPQPDADRRLIYVTNLDPWALVAIASTASQPQVGFLRDFIYKHLALRSFIGVKLPPYGLPMFALEFHLPFFAWRPDIDGQPLEDDRRRGTGDALRKVHTLDFLATPSSSEEKQPVGFLYEAQISILVTGLDHWFWTAYAFVDTYYKSEDNLESVEYYNSPAIALDPVAGGESPLLRDSPIWRPREYFIRVLESRMGQVKAEWRNAVDMLLARVKPHTDDYLLAQSDRSSGSGNTHRKQAQSCFGRARSRLQQVASLLSQTIDAWDTFRSGDLEYFLDLLKDTNVPAERPLHTIDKHVEEMRDLRKYLLHQIKLLEGHEREIEMHIQREDNALGDHMKGLTTITMVFVPVTVVSQMFSIPEILPFTPTFGAYLLAVLVCTVILLIIWTVVLKWDWYLRLYRAVVRRKVRVDDGDSSTVVGSGIEDREGIGTSSRNCGSDEIELDPLLGIRLELE